MLTRQVKRVACVVVAALASAAVTADAWAATNGQWVVVDSGDASEALVTLNPITRHDLGREERRIYSAPAGHALDAPQWSPSGNQIAFTERAPGGSRVLVHDFTTGGLREVASDAAAPSWSADGTRVAFVRDGQLLTRRIDGSDEQVLPIDGTGVRDVAWSPDGELLALWVGDRIDLATADGAERETVGEAAAGGAAWAPDANEFRLLAQRARIHRPLSHLGGLRRGGVVPVRPRPPRNGPRARLRAGRDRARVHGPRRGHVP